MSEKLERKIEQIERLIENKAGDREIFEVIASEKDPETAFDAVLNYFQKKVPWSEKILLPPFKAPLHSMQKW
jgi:acetone carboxylase gamma subunit